MMSLPTYMGSFPAPGSYAPGSFCCLSSYPYAGDSMPTSMYGGPTDQETDDRPTEVEEDPTEPPATVDLTGKAMFIGLLSGCTVGADLDGDGKVSGDEPTDTTDDFGGWTLTVDEDEVDPDGLTGPSSTSWRGRSVDRSTAAHCASRSRPPRAAASSPSSRPQLELFEEAQEASTTELEDDGARDGERSDREGDRRGGGGHRHLHLRADGGGGRGRRRRPRRDTKSTVEIDGGDEPDRDCRRREEPEGVRRDGDGRRRTAEIQLKNADDASKAEGFATGDTDEIKQLVTAAEGDQGRRPTDDEVDELTEVCDFISTFVGEQLTRRPPTWARRRPRAR